MRFLGYLLFQLDEARRYIEDGRPEHLRLAFLLLDNAAEIQMVRRIKEDLQHDDFKEKIRNNTLSLAGQGTLPETLQELIDWVPLTRAERSKLDRFFDEKVDYMAGKGKHLDVALAGPLKHLHKYRNEAYHHAKIRTETIRTAALLLLEINCQMVLAVSPGPRSISSDDDYSWLEQRFNVDRFAFRLDLPSIADQIRSGLLPSDNAVASALADHLRDRLSLLHDALDFIVENSELSSKEAALKESQFYAEARRTAELLQKPAVNAFVPTYSLRSIQEMETQLSQIRSAPNRLNAFDRFAAVERALEPVETCVNELAWKIDEAIQLAIDIARGK
jgi:hypothetical protein